MIKFVLRTPSGRLSMERIWKVLTYFCGQTQCEQENGEIKAIRICCVSVIRSTLTSNDSLITNNRQSLSLEIPAVYQETPKEGNQRRAQQCQIFQYNRSALTFRILCACLCICLAHVLFGAPSCFFLLLLLLLHSLVHFSLSVYSIRS